MSQLSELFRNLISNFNLITEDKGYHFIQTQLVTSLEGEMWSVEFLSGHNNDQGALNMTIGCELMDLQRILLGDRGIVSTSIYYS